MKVESKKGNAVRSITENMDMNEKKTQRMERDSERKRSSARDREKREVIEKIASDLAQTKWSKAY